MAKIKYRRYYIYYVLRVAIFLVSLLPLRVSVAVAGFLGKVGFAVLPWYRDITIANLEAAFGHDERRNRAIARSLFSNLAKNGAEWIKLSVMKPSELDALVTEVEGLENLKEALAAGKGIVAVASHFGDWELISMYIRQKGYHGAVVARRIYFYKYDKLITGLRGRYDVKVIYRDESPKKILKFLKENGIMGIVPDQDVDSIEGVFVDFFGRPAYTPTAPVKLAMVSGAKMLPMFMVRKPDGTHKLVIDKPIDVSPSSRSEEDVKNYTQQWTAVLEKYIREYPDQWVWVHERWKTQPPAQEPQPEMTAKR